MEPLRQLTISKHLSQTDLNKKNVVVTTTTTTTNPTKVQKLVEEFHKLNSNEKLLFLVDLGGKPSSSSTFCNTDQPPQNSGTTSPTTSEQNTRLLKTSEWLLDNFTSDSQCALPKEEVYSFYTRSFSTRNSTNKPISTADFGKLVRQVFPDVKARRLGQRGASRYCFANIRKKSDFDIEKPSLINEIKINSTCEEFLAWGKGQFGMSFNDMETLLNFLKSGNFKQTLTSQCQGRKRRNSSMSSVKKLLFLSNKEEEDKEVRNIFGNNNNNTASDQVSSEWPQLRTLLSSSTAAMTQQQAGIKKRHCSFNNPSISSFSTTTKNSTLLQSGLQEQNHLEINRSASVPVPNFHHLMNERFLTSGQQGLLNLRSFSADSGYDSATHTPINILTMHPATTTTEEVENNMQNFNNPLLSSVNHLEQFDSVFDEILMSQELEEEEEGRITGNSSEGGFIAVDF